MAQRALLSGDLEAARTHLTPVIRSSPEEPWARFLLANLFLEEGRLGEALRLARGLKADLPFGEAAILESLIASRHAGRPWRQALIAGWQTSRSPDLTLSIPLEAPPLPPDLPERLARAIDATEDAHEQALLELLSTDPSSSDRLAALLPALDEPRIAAAVMTRLRHPRGGAPSVAHLEAVRRRAGELARREPQTAQLGLIALLARSRADAPFSEEELAELERLSALRAVEPDHIRALFDDARRCYRRHRLPLSSGEVLRMVSSTLSLEAEGQLLRRRTRASRRLLTASQQERLAEAMWTLGSAIQAVKELGTRITGSELMLDAARLQDDADRRRKATHVLQLTREVRATSRRIAWELWPLPSVQDAFAEAHAEDPYNAADEVTSIRIRMDGLP